MGKGLNFGFVFGMGKAKLIAMLVKAIYDFASKQKEIGLMTLSDFEKPFIGNELFLLANPIIEAICKTCRFENIKFDNFENFAQRAGAEIFNKYHETYPSIRRFSKAVRRKIETTGKVKNIFGRVFRCKDYQNDFGFKLVNYLCQGGASDYLKNRLNPFIEELCPKFNAKFFLTVHDSVFAFVPFENAVKFYQEGVLLLESGKTLDIPILAEGKIGVKSLARLQTIKRGATEAEILQALEDSKKIEPCSSFFVDNEEEL
jgi:hypothetical protein